MILHAYGFSEDEAEEKLNAEYDAEEFLFERLQANGESLADFTRNLIRGLMPLIFVGQSPLTKRQHKGFGVHLGGGNVRAICKIIDASHVVKNPPCVDDVPEE